MTKKKPGPKPLPLDQGKRVPLNMRTTKELRQKIEAKATASGRSLAQEVEHRLERSLYEDSLLDVLERLAVIKKPLPPAYHKMIAELNGPVPWKD